MGYFINAEFYAGGNYHHFYDEASLHRAAELERDIKRLGIEGRVSME